MNYEKKINSIVSSILTNCINNADSFSTIFYFKHAEIKLGMYDEKNNTTSPLNYIFEDIKTSQDLEFIIKYLLDEYLINLHFARTEETTYFTISIQGFQYYNNLFNRSVNSNKAFISMSFDIKDKWIYDDCIQPVLQKLNLEPVKVNELNTLKNIKNDTTINDFIVSLIKQSKFCIADLTSNKNGVYFETGYAMGSGKQVIFTCNVENLKDVHFNTNHYPILVYTDKNDYIDKLEAAILARIE